VLLQIVDHLKTIEHWSQSNENRSWRAAATGWVDCYCKALGYCLLSLSSLNGQLFQIISSDMVNFFGWEILLNMFILHSTGEDMDYLGYPVQTDCYTHSAQQRPLL
jgi:hypothetical protein